MSVREQWQKEVAEALTILRLERLYMHKPTGVERELLRSGVSEIVKLRLFEAYQPIFATLETIEKKLESLK